MEVPERAAPQQKPWNTGRHDIDRRGKRIAGELARAENDCPRPHRRRHL